MQLFHIQNGLPPWPVNMCLFSSQSLMPQNFKSSWTYRSTLIRGWGWTLLLESFNTNMSQVCLESKMYFAGQEEIFRYLLHPHPLHLICLCESYIDDLVRIFMYWWMISWVGVGLTGGPRFHKRVGLPLNSIPWRQSLRLPASHIRSLIGGGV